MHSLEDSVVLLSIRLATPGYAVWVVLWCGWVSVGGWGRQSEWAMLSTLNAPVECRKIGVLDDGLLLPPQSRWVAGRPGSSRGSRHGSTS